MGGVGASSPWVSVTIQRREQFRLGVSAEREVGLVVMNVVVPSSSSFCSFGGIRR